MFTAGVEAHQEPIEALRSEGEELKVQGSPDDGKKVDHWVNDLAQRWDELGGAVDDRMVLLILLIPCVCTNNARQSKGKHSKQSAKKLSCLEGFEDTISSLHVWCSTH